MNVTGPNAKRPDLLVGVLIFVFTCTFYLLARVNQVSDSRYSMLVSQSLLDRGRFDFDGYQFKGIDPRQPPPPAGNGAYQLEYVNGHIYYFFPVGSSLLSLPYVALVDVLGYSCVSPDGTHLPRVEDRIQLTLAAMLMAVLACLIFATARLLLSVGSSVVVSLGCALGTQMASTASRALWTDTWGIVLVGIVVYILLGHEARGHRIRPVLLASLLAWSYLVRPTNAVSVLGVTAYLFLYQRPNVARYVITGVCWLAGFAAYSLHHFGQVLPNYYLANRLTFDSFWVALAGNLVSPSRGIFVFIPALLFLGYLLVRYRGELPYKPLIALSLAIVAAHILVVSGFPHWWGGHSYGPRLMTGSIPWFALLGILALKARADWRERNPELKMSQRARRERFTGCALLILSIAIHVNGATNGRTYAWNARPVDVDTRPERLWDWGDLQFLAR